MSQKANPLALLQIYLKPDTGKVMGLFLPIAVLVFATVYFMVSSGADVLAAKDLPFKCTRGI